MLVNFSQVIRQLVN